MSVSALDQLLLSIAGARPPLAAAAKKRDSFAAHDLLLPTPFHRRERFQPTTTNDRNHQHQQQRKRQHAHAQKHAPQLLHPQSSLSLRLYGLKKNGWPRTLLTALRVDVDALSRPTHALQPSTTRGLAMDTNVRLFFDGLLRQATGTAPSSPWRRPSSSVLKFAATKSRPRLQLAVGASQHDAPVVGIPIDREIELVRSRRKSPRRMSSAVGKRSRRCSSYEPREAQQKANSSTVDTEEDLDRMEAVIDAATASAMRVVAAEANAQLSFELMERKASNNTHYAATYGAPYAAWGLDAHSVALQPSRDGSLDTDAPSEDAREELEVLRAENAEQKAIIRQLLIENRRLLAQQQQHHQQSPLSPGSDVSVPTKRKRLSDSSEQEERNRGASSASTVSGSSSSPISRRGSLTFSVVDGYETFVDHKFDHLVSEITSELAELLSEDAFSSPPRTSTGASECAAVVSGR